MAAGMGSRFGGMKQLEPVGKYRQVLLHYSVYDALRAGFDRVVFIIKRNMEADFRELAGDRIARHADVSYVFQDIPEHRKKPYGTGEAILCAEQAISTPFAVINADDFYGAEAFSLLRKGISAPPCYCMVGYRLFNTLSDNGSVSRGICSVKDGCLTDVTEHTEITRDTALDPETVVSMNMWGLQPDIFPLLREKFGKFLTEADITRDEFQIPKVIDEIIKTGIRRVKVFKTSETWYGMTYREDKQKVCDAIAAMTQKGLYPECLWE